MINNEKLNAEIKKLGAGLDDKSLSVDDLGRMVLDSSGTIVGFFENKVYRDDDGPPMMMLTGPYPVLEVITADDGKYEFKTWSDIKVAMHTSLAGFMTFTTPDGKIFRNFGEALEHVQ
jgi:hypothetical protein